MTGLPITAPPLTDTARRRRWINGTTTQLEAARMALLDLPDAEGPESMEARQRLADDRLADGVHEHAARARRAVREALDLIYAQR